ncbi:MAG: DUF4384 domain-containing protein, partial [Nitrospirae bacterium]|nr:DUF4384 domain-containing protein [Nitrospirota bacterium]
MSNRVCLTIVSVCVSLFIFTAFSAFAAPKGAKAIFDSGEGPSTGVSVKPTSREPVVQQEKEKYIGVSYQLVLLKEDGQFQVVSKSRTFRTGERLKILVRSNKAGYMTIMNIGPTGNTHVLFNEYVEAFTMQEIPRNTNLRFAGAPGTEKLLIMLSNEPNPMAGQPPVTTTSAPS